MRIGVTARTPRGVGNTVDHLTGLAAAHDPRIAHDFERLRGAGSTHIQLGESHPHREALAGTPT